MSLYFHKRRKAYLEAKRTAREAREAEMNTDTPAEDEKPKKQAKKEE